MMVAKAVISCCLLIGAVASSTINFTAQPAAPWVNDTGPLAAASHFAQQEFSTTAGAVPSWSLSSGSWATVGIAIGAPPGNSQGMFIGMQ